MRLVTKSLASPLNAQINVLSMELAMPKVHVNARKDSKEKIAQSVNCVEKYLTIF